MLYKQFIELFDILDSAEASGAQVKAYLEGIRPECRVETYPLEGPKGHTDMVRVLIPGKNGKSSGGTAGTIGILGRLGGLGAREEKALQEKNLAASLKTAEAAAELALHAVFLFRLPGGVRDAQRTHGRRDSLPSTFLLRRGQACHEGARRGTLQKAWDAVCPRPDFQRLRAGRPSLDVSGKLSAGVYGGGRAFHGQMPSDVELPLY